MSDAQYQHVGTPRIRLTEECSELIKALCKADRFGLATCHPNTPGYTNKQVILDEIGDVERCIFEVRRELYSCDGVR